MQVNNGRAAFGMGSFSVEYEACNLTVAGITRKLYIVPNNEVSAATSHDITLDDCARSAIAHAATAAPLSEFSAGRFQPYDVSLREDGSVGVCYLDSRQHENLNLAGLLSVSGINPGPISNTICTIAHSIFGNNPRYNPVFMIGVLSAHGMTTMLKAYVRFDQEGITLDDRIGMLLRTSCAAGASACQMAELEAHTRALEVAGLPFSFMGVDSDRSGKIRRKVYYRLHRRFVASNITAYLANAFPEIVRASLLKDLLSEYGADIQVIGLSLSETSAINGVQLYFRPRL